MCVCVCMYIHINTVTHEFELMWSDNSLKLYNKHFFPTVVSTLL